MLRRIWYLGSLLSLGLLVLWVMNGRSAAQAQTPTLFIRWDAAQPLPTNLQPLRTLDYDTFLWLEIEAPALAQLNQGVTPNSTPSWQVADFQLTLGEQTADPLRETAFAPLQNPQQTAPALQLLQLIGPTRDSWLATLEGEGIDIVQYIHPYTYIVWAAPQTLTDLGGTPQADFVRWRGSLGIEHKLQLTQSAASGALPDSPQPFQLLLYAGGDAYAFAERLGQLDGELTRQTAVDDQWLLAEVILHPDRLPQLATLPHLLTIQPRPALIDGGIRGELSSQINVGNVGGNNQALPGYQAWLQSAGVDGSGVLVASVDTGLYEEHPDLVNRLVSCTGFSCDPARDSGHGTHTAAIIAGDGASGTLSPDGFLRGLGVAPGAQLFEQYSGAYNTIGMQGLITDSVKNGAVISSNSWGPSSVPLGYDIDSKLVDSGVRDGDLERAGFQPLVYVVAIMNGYGGTSTQGSPDEAKNLIAVGSTKARKSDSVQDLKINDVSLNSAHGPALDGRLLPDLVAPGCDVDSARTESGYLLDCGTSMAAPQVAGTAALFFEKYREMFGDDPSPALVKAALLPVAHDLVGNQDADGGTLGHRFDNKQGWGRLNTTAVVSPSLPVLYFDQPLVLTDSGAVFSTTIYAVDPSQPVRLMLAWTDAPGSGLGGSTPAWVNDLDLRVITNGVTYLGNQFGTQGWSVSGGTPDGKNNTEGVLLAEGGAEALQVVVQASNLAGDGVPGNGDLTDQDFALVCYNCTTELEPQPGSVWYFPMMFGGP